MTATRPSIALAPQTSKGDLARIPRVKRITSDRNFASERQFQEWLVGYLRRTNSSFVGAPYLSGIQTEVTTPLGGRADIIVPQRFVIECKLHLAPDSIAQAIGQLWLYYRYFPGHHPVVAGCVPSDTRLDRQLERAVLESGSSLWAVSINNKR